MGLSATNKEEKRGKNTFLQSLKHNICAEAVLRLKELKIYCHIVIIYSPRNLKIYYDSDEPLSQGPPLYVCDGIVMMPLCE